MSGRGQFQCVSAGKVPAPYPRGMNENEQVIGRALRDAGVPSDQISDIIKTYRHGTLALNFLKDAAAIDAPELSDDDEPDVAGEVSGDTPGNETGEAPPLLGIKRQATEAFSFN